MSEEEHATWKDLARTFLLIAGIAGTLWGGGTWVYSMTELVATKTYHDADRDAMLEKIDQELIAPLRKSAENTEASAVVQRIQNILDLKCRAEVPAAVDEILAAQLARYKELTKREFGRGRCVNGKRVTEYEVVEDGSPIH